MKLFCLFFVFITFLGWSQKEIEVAPPYHIKTVGFYQNNTVVFPYFRLGETFELRFDDLYSNEEDYYYTITQCNRDWTPSILAKVEYLTGVDNQRIITYENSINTLQSYSHYKQPFPNPFNTITKSGNYIIKIFNDSQELIFSKKFIVYEELIQVAALVRKSRTLSTINAKQNLDFTINLRDNVLQNPRENIKVSIFQNGRWDTEINGLKPQYTIGNELVYRYNEETQFWAGNEYLNFDTSIFRAANATVMQYTSSGDMYNAILYPNYERKNKTYTFFPDVNGIFVVSNRNAENPSLQADYNWINFKLFAPTTVTKKNIYIVGMFNNYALTDENKMEYKTKEGYYEANILIKQGFVNYEYAIADTKGTIDWENAVDGNYFQTENIYNIFVYYRGNNERYDRIIANGSTSSFTMQN